MTVMGGRVPRTLLIIINVYVNSGHIQFQGPYLPGA